MKKGSRYVTVEWREGMRYRCANYEVNDVPTLLATLRARRDAGITIPAVYVDDTEVSL